MKLLVSPKSLEEALECIKGNADIIDVKNPLEGSLGANFPWVIRAIRDKAPKEIPVSATLGDINYKPGTVALAALGAVVAGAFFVKVGLFDIKTKEEGIEIMKAVKQVIDEFHYDRKIVAAGYAEGVQIGSIDPSLIPEIAHESKSDYAMLDTYNKKARKTIFEILSFDNLRKFIDDSQKYNVGTALGGSIQLEHIPKLKELQPDIIGIRGAVCEKGDRLEGKIQADKIINFKEKLSE